MDNEKSLMLRSKNWQLTRATDYALFHCDTINVTVAWGANRADAPLIRIQNHEMSELEKALERLDYLLSHVRCVRTLTLNMETSETRSINAIIERFLDAENVRLEVLKVRRRYVGQRIDLLPDLLCMNAETLREVGKIGLSEATEGFNDKIRLNRLSLMNFDLIDDGELESSTLAERTRIHIRRLGGIGAKFQHLSYTTYSGFDLSRNPALFMLKQCEVRSIRLTMQKGAAITSTPMQPVQPLLDTLERLELIGSLSAPKERLSALFPNLDYYDYQRQDLATGGQTAMAC
ncbi:unnamed protein product [Bursaphelenchus xylophilus]|uniref:(pine wood nematode) hypothetical protein n=1 Tax=Bursaphelenchus xylophilus TaxID=6326 RepID=A0A1I7RSS7_BURXY|nr:unnamed protein product [Bursaphelenchus xylophilus]CAG9122816.1 unnamed protein product [Bursaphelenchus xylophilus]